MNKLKKTHIVRSYRDLLVKSNSIIFFQNCGMKVSDFISLRRNLKTFDSKILCIKKRLFNIATSNKYRGYVVGGAVIIAHGSDIVSLSQKLVHFSTTKPINILGGIFQDKGVEKKFVEYVSRIPPLRDIQYKIISLLRKNNVGILCFFRHYSSKIIKLIKIHYNIK